VHYGSVWDGEITFHHSRNFLKLWQGADKRGIKLVIQYNSNDPDTNRFLQRAGRAARGPGETGYAIALAKKTSSDEARRELDARAQTKGKKHKHALNNDDDNGGCQSLPKQGPKAIYTGHDAYLEKNYGQSDEHLRIKYANNGLERLKAGAKGGIPDAVMEDYMNAKERGLNCRRRVLDIAYENSNRGESE
jgi:superfamily II DNA/RNA helicase